MAMANTDLEEGKGIDKPIGIFFERDVAEMAVRGQDVQGRNGWVQEVFVFETVGEWAEELKGDRKEIALYYLKEDDKELQRIFDEEDRDYG